MPILYFFPYYLLILLPFIDTTLDSKWLTSATPNSSVHSSQQNLIVNSNKDRQHLSNHLLQNFSSRHFWLNNDTANLEYPPRKIRQVASATENNFTWKITKTPPFVTSKLKKQNAEPIVQVYPPDTVYRSGRSHELALPQEGSGKRIIYYATLPDVKRYPLPAADDRYSDYLPLPVIPVSNQQRSYVPNKIGKDFVTRVQSSIIDVRPKEESKNKDVSTPMFTIIDASPTPHSAVGLDRVMYPEYLNHLDYGSLNAYTGDKTLFPRPYMNSYKTPYSSSLPYFNPTANFDKSQYHISQYQYQQQSSPYYSDVQKIHGSLPHHLQPAVTTSSLHNSSPYPTRHTRFPMDRYPPSSPLSDLVSSSLPVAHSNANLQNSAHHYSMGHSSNYGIDGPSSFTGSSSLGGGSSFGSSLDGSSLGASSLDFEDNLTPTLDHSLDLDYHRFPNLLKDKFANYNYETLGQKYLNLHNSFNTGDDFPFKFSDQSSFSSPFSQVSDWLTNKPFDMSSFELDDFNAAAAAANTAAVNQDYFIKGSSFISGDSYNRQKNMTNPVTEANNTIITPFTMSFSNSSQETRTMPTRWDQKLDIK